MRARALQVFIDEVIITVKAGDGGNGCLAFRREKFVPRGGPSGGDGGNGGEVILVASQHYNTLLHFRFNPEHKAERGRHGEGSQRTGAEGHTIEVKVPVGTVVYDEMTGERLHDFTSPAIGLSSHAVDAAARQCPLCYFHAPGADRARRRKTRPERKLRLELKLLQTSVWWVSTQASPR